MLSLLLPTTAHFAEKLGFPERACTAADVRRFVGWDNGSVGGWLTFKTGNMYWSRHGYVCSFESPNSYYNLQDFSRTPDFFGPLIVTRSEAIQVARDAIRKLGYPEEMVYADLEPEVSEPPPAGTNSIPRFLVRWPAPNRNHRDSARFEVNGTTRRVESVTFSNSNLDRKTPPLGSRTTAAEDEPAEVVAHKGPEMLADALPKLTMFARALGLPVQTPIATNHVASYVFYHDESSGPVPGKVTLRSGFVFMVATERVLGFDAPDAFFGEHEVRVRDFLGKRNLTEPQALAAARTALRRLGYSERVVGTEPEVERPYGAARNLVPRCVFWWIHGEAVRRPARIELDCESGSVKSLALW